MNYWEMRDTTNVLQAAKCRFIYGYTLQNVEVWVWRIIRIKIVRKSKFSSSEFIVHDARWATKPQSIYIFIWKENVFNKPFYFAQYQKHWMKYRVTNKNHYIFNIFANFHTIYAIRKLITKSYHISFLLPNCNT